MDIKSVPFGWATAYGNSDTGTALRQPLTGWFNCGEFSDARATLEFRGPSSADVEIRIALEFADFADQTTTTIKPLGLFISTVGINYPNNWEAIEVESRANQIVRVVAEGQLKTGTGLQVVRISGRVDLKSC